MDFTSINAVAYIGNKVSIDGVEFEITTALDSEITAVQYHKGSTYLLEEPLMKQVPFSKYSYILDEFMEALAESQTEEEVPYNLEEDISTSIQKLVDEKAQSFKYDDINSISKYLGYDNIFRVQCEQLGKWCSACWEKAINIRAEVIAETRVQPTKDEVIAEMPIYSDFEV